MLVLGYANSTDATEPSIAVPPFHTGHLGFVPDTPVRISLVATPAAGRHCEVVVTPFEQDFRYLAFVSVTMRDEPGVVGRLIAAVAHLGINIEVQESSSINLLSHHFVSLLVDLSESSMSGRAEFSTPAAIPVSPTAVQRLYRNYDSVFPVRDLRFVRLFESIVAHCADVIVWKEVSGEYYPDISIRGYSDRPLTKSEVQPLVRGASPLHVTFAVPDGITHRLQRVLGADNRFEYLLVSDTVARSLHVFFLHPDITERLFHVGFFHDDVPGALATILTLLRDAHFNILTSLMRKQASGRSVWEAVLEYQGDAQVPSSDCRPAHSPLSQADLSWICDEVIKGQKTNKSEIIDCDIVVAPPKYPARPEGAERAEPVLLSSQLSPLGGKPQLKRPPVFSDLIEARRKGLKDRKLDADVTHKTEELLDLIGTRGAEGEQPVVFLSYPRSAKGQGDATYKALGQEYRVERYQEPDGETIVDEVIGKIESSDYFIGIWHHEDEPASGETTRSISPWMLFEYGVARAAGKPAFVVHSDKLDNAIWMRIDPGVSTPGYSDLDFKDRTLRTILDYCQRHFQ